MQATVGILGELEVVLVCKDKRLLGVGVLVGLELSNVVIGKRNKDCNRLPILTMNCAGE